MIRQATLSAQLDDGLVLPWEQGVVPSVFRRALAEDQPFNQPLRKSQSEDAGSGAGASSEKSQGDVGYHTMYERAIRFRNTLTDMKLTRQNDRALKTLCSHDLLTRRSSPRCANQARTYGHQPPADPHLVWTSTSSRSASCVGRAAQTQS